MLFVSFSNYLYYNLTIPNAALRIKDASSNEILPSLFASAFVAACPSRFSIPRAVLSTSKASANLTSPSKSASPRRVSPEGDGDGVLLPFGVCDGFGVSFEGVCDGFGVSFPPLLSNAVLSAYNAFTCSAVKSVSNVRIEANL